MPEESICPNCGSKDVILEKKQEYTGGGYADYWDEYECQNCGEIWRGEEHTDHY